MSDDKCKVILQFPDEQSLDRFLGWFCDGGGEQDFFRAESDIAGHGEAGFVPPINPIVGFDYTHCFPSWGYNPDKDGVRVVEARKERT